MCRETGAGMAAITVPDYCAKRGKSLAAPIRIPGERVMRKSFVAVLMCGVMFGQPASAAMVTPSAISAAPAVSTSVVAQAIQSGHLVSGAADAEVIKVRKRKRHFSRKSRHRRYHRRRRGSSFGAGLAVGIIGALVAKGISEAAAEDRFSRCARDYRSFDPETGTIITRSGREVLCPYLR